MKRDLYRDVWVQGLYEDQPRYPGESMTLENAKRVLENIYANPMEYLDPPEGLTIEEFMETWNMAHARALAWVQE